MGDSYLVTELPLNELTLAAELMAKAYKDDPVITTSFSAWTDSKRDAALRSYFELLLKLGASFGTNLCIHLKEKLAGVAIIYAPDQYPLKGWRYLWIVAKMTLSFMPKVGPSKFMKVLQMGNDLSRVHPKEPHYYGEIVCVAPEFQKNGVGFALTKELFRRADAIQVPVYGETSNADNLPVWKHAGYEVTKEHILGGVTYWSLLRPKTIEEHGSP